MTPDDARELIHVAWMGGVAICGFSTLVFFWSIMAMGSKMSRREEARGE